MSKHNTNEYGSNVSQVGSESRTPNQSQNVAKIHVAIAKIHAVRQGEKDDRFVQHEVEEKFTKEEILLFAEQYNESEVHLSGRLD